MELKKENFNNFHLIHISGNIDLLDDTKVIEKEIESLLSIGELDVAVDFSDVSYIYSGIIQIIVKYFNKFRKINRGFSIIESNPKLYDVLAVIGLTRVMNIYVSLDDFKKSLTI